MAKELNVYKKDKALELMKQLDIYQPYIDGLQENDYVYELGRFGSI